MVAASHGERPPLHVVPSTSPVSVNWCSTQHAGVNVGTGEGWDVGTDVGWCENDGSAEGGVVGTPVGLRENAVGVGSAVGKVVGTDVGVFVGAAVGDVGTADGADVGKIVGTGVGTSAVGPTVVSSSRRAPSRRPLDRRAFGPLRGGRCPPTNALRSQHRQAIMKATAAPSSRWGLGSGTKAVHAGFQARLQRREGQYHTCPSSDDGLKGAFFHRA